MHSQKKDSKLSASQAGTNESAETRSEVPIFEVPEETITNMSRTVDVTCGLSPLYFSRNTSMQVNFSLPVLGDGTGCQCMHPTMCTPDPHSSSEPKLASLAGHGMTDLHLPESIESCVDQILFAGRLTMDRRPSLLARIHKLADYAVSELTDRGYCGVSKLLGDFYAKKVLQVAQSLYAQGIYVPGEHAQPGAELVRSDSITWVGPEKLSSFPGLQILISFLDGLILAIGSRLTGTPLHSKTRAMLARYPGPSTGYKQHFDNPSELSDGRYLTCIYYLNADWCGELGGKLVLCPTALNGHEVALAPLLDRLVIFFSDERTLHRVQPTSRERFAVTVWYFEPEARAQYWSRRQSEMEKQEGLSRAWEAQFAPR